MREIDRHMYCHSVDILLASHLLHSCCIPGRDKRPPVITVEVQKGGLKLRLCLAQLRVQQQLLQHMTIDLDVEHTDFVVESDNFFAPWTKATIVEQSCNLWCECFKQQRVHVARMAQNLREGELDWNKTAAKRLM